MSTSKNTFIPKSLHTVTAIAHVAAYLMRRGFTAATAVEEAALILGQMGKSDVYGLLPAALKTITTSAAPVAGLSDKGAVASASVN